MDVLQQVTFHLPNNDRHFGDALLSLLAAFGDRNGDRVDLRKSDPTFLPNICFVLDGVTRPTVEFDIPDHPIEIALENKTGQERKSREVYRHIDVEDFVGRMSHLETVRLDHVGFDLPWFDGVHPDILMLRRELGGRSAYYRFPTGEEWDFILPASPDEIRNNTLDLGKDRHPKLEIVSFEKSSTPLIQLDFSVRETFEALVSSFPEGIVDRGAKNVWVYVANAYGIDVCFVIGEHQDGDWSGFFDGHRLRASDNE